MLVIRAFWTGPLLMLAALACWTWAAMLMMQGAAMLVIRAVWTGAADALDS